MCDDCGEQCKSKDKLGEHGKRMHNVLSKKERPIVVPTDHPADSETRGQEVETGPEPWGGHFLPGEAVCLLSAMLSGEDITQSPLARHGEALIQWSMPGGAVELLSAMLSVEDIAKALQARLNLTGGPPKRRPSDGICLEEL